jgi:MATE family multidrug resistance protein
MSMRGDLLRLAVPLAIMHIGHVLLGIVDSAVLGRWDPQTLAGAGISASVLNTVFMVASGTVMGLETLIPQALGAGESDRARSLLSRGRWLALILFLPTAVVIALIPLIMSAFEVDPSVRAVSFPYLLARIPGVLPGLLFMADRSYLQALGHTRALVISIVVGNLFNLGLDIGLVFGVEALGIPALGEVGAGLATSFVSFVMYGVAVAGVRMSCPRYRVMPVSMLAIVRLGFPLGLQICAEFGLFAISSLLAGRLGKIPAAAHMVAISAASAAYAIMLGVGGAASVLVGRAIGAGDVMTARRFGRLAVSTGVSIGAGTALLFILVPHWLAALFTDFADVLPTAATLIMISAVFQFSDAVQAVTAGALRGLGENRFAFVANVVGHYAIGLPIAALLGFHFRMGAPGLWWGLTAGLTSVAAALIFRFERRVLHTVRV